MLNMLFSAPIRGVSIHFPKLPRGKGPLPARLHPYQASRWYSRAKHFRSPANRMRTLIQITTLCLQQVHFRERLRATAGSEGFRTQRHRYPSVCSGPSPPGKGGQHHDFEICPMRYRRGHDNDPLRHTTGRCGNIGLACQWQGKRKDRCGVARKGDGEERTASGTYQPQSQEDYQDGGQETQWAKVDAVKRISEAYQASRVIPRDNPDKKYYAHLKARVW